VDIKPKRREAVNPLPDDWPGESYARGSAASEENCYWWARASSWQAGANVFDYQDVISENNEEHARWGTPYQDNLPQPNGVPSNNGFSGVASRNPDDPLPNPANFHSNPGFMATSTASAQQAAQPGSAYRVPGPGSPNVGHRPMPVGGRQRQRPAGNRHAAQPSTQADPRSEGSPLVVSTGQGQW
jgi:hypothetical protein